MKLKADLHVHSSYSEDSFIKPLKIVEICQKKGINCLAITDHNEIKGAQEAQKIAPFKIIIGEEIKTTQGEIIGYFLKERIQPGLSPEQTIQEIKKQGGLIAIPHPFDFLRRGVIKKKALERIIKMVDMVEIFNSRNLFEASNIKAAELCKLNNKTGFAGSDAHTVFEIGSAQTELEDFNNQSEFIVNLNKASFKTKKSPIWVHLLTTANKFYKLLKK
jgi:hypothetical protein